MNDKWCVDLRSDLCECSLSHAVLVTGQTVPFPVKQIQYLVPRPRYLNVWEINFLDSMMSIYKPLITNKVIITEGKYLTSKVSHSGLGRSRTLLPVSRVCCQLGTFLPFLPTCQQTVQHCITRSLVRKMTSQSCRAKYNYDVIMYDMVNLQIAWFAGRHSIDF